MVTVPPAAMHENDLPAGRKHDVGSAWQVSAVNTKAVPQRVAEAAHSEFWLRALSADASHECASLRGR